MHITKPSLTELGLSQNFSLFAYLRDRIGHANRIIITEALTSRVSLWSNSLVCLKLNCVMDITQFLLTASNSVWPQLARLDLMGFLDQYNDGSDGAVDRRERACSDMLEGLVVALPSMPRLMGADIRFWQTRGYNWSFFFRMDLTPRTKTEWQDMTIPHQLCSKGPVLPCGSLPSCICGVVQAHRITLPGQLVTELQNTVRQHRRLELPVFCCKEDLGKEDPVLGYVRTETYCKVWNRETGSWDPALMNDMDMFIYDMGQYWSQVHHEWW